MHGAEDRGTGETGMFRQGEKISGIGAADERGVTLVEMMVAVAVFAIVVAMALEMSLIASRATTDTVNRSVLEGEAESAAVRLVESLSACTKLWSYSDTHFVVFSVPVDNDSNGTVLDKGDMSTGLLPTIEWGAAADDLPAPIPGGEIVYFFGGAGATDPETGQMGTFRTIVESVENVDINGDGDMNDSFDMGTIYRRIAGATPSVIPLSGPNVIQRSGVSNYGKCIKHDNCTFGCTSGRIFFLDGSYVMHVNLWMLKIPESRRPILVHAHQQVYLRNQD